MSNTSKPFSALGGRLTLEPLSQGCTHWIKAARGITVDSKATAILAKKSASTANLFPLGH